MKKFLDTKISLLSWLAYLKETIHGNSTFSMTLMHITLFNVFKSKYKDVYLKNSLGS